MPSIAIKGFDGLVPRSSPTMLADSQAQIAENVKLYARELRYWRGSLAVAATLVPDARSIYKYYASAPDPYWLSWSADNVSVVRSPQKDTTDYRIYYTGDGVPKKATETLVATGSGAYPRGWLNMGVPAPTGAPSVTPSGGSGSQETRAYVYTYISTFGSITEESAPSPAALATSYVDATWTIGGFTAAPSQNYNITALRIYRSVTGATTNTYQFVAEIAVTTSSYADTLTTAQLGAVLGSLGWTPPPSTLAGLVSLPSGALAGFSGNTVYFSEPYYPHAWPLAYALNIPAKIVGLGTYGTSVVVMTDRYPYIINGGIPGSMSVEKIPALEPCINARTITTNKAGVAYAGPTGIVEIGPSVVGVQTGAIFRRDEWQAVNPLGLAACVTYDDKFFALHSEQGQKSFIVSGEDVPALSKLSIRANAAHIDSGDGSLFYVGTDNVLYKFDGDELAPIVYEWKSKRFVLPQATSFSALKVDGDYDQSSLADAYNAQVAAIVAANQAAFGGALDGCLNDTPLNFYPVNGSVLQPIPAPAQGRTVQILLYGCDGALEATLNASSFDPIRIPPFKSRSIEILIRGNLSVRSVMLATTVQELVEAAQNG